MFTCKNVSIKANYANSEYRCSVLACKNESLIQNGLKSGENGEPQFYTHG